MLKPAKKVRVNGQLVETTEEELRSLAEKSGLPAPPVTPVGAANVGANPDVAKMSGSTQQRQAAVSTPLKAKDTLQGAQRLDTPRTQASGAEAASAQKAGKLQSLSGLDTRVQALVAQQLKNVNTDVTAAPKYNEAQFSTLAPTANRAGIEQLLTQYQTQTNALRDPNLTPEQKTAAQAAAFQAMADLKNQHGINNPDDYLDLSSSTLGDAAGQSVMDPGQVTIGSLDVSQLGIAPAEVESLLGPGWESLSVAQFQSRVEDLRQAEYQRINGLRAQLATLAPGSAQRESIMRELGDAAQVGVTGVEQNVRQLAEKLSVADVVQFGGRSMPVGELLKDEKISRIVADYLNPAGDPKLKESLAADHPEFAQWINNNQAALTALSQEMDKGKEGFSSLQDQQAALATVGEDVTLNDEVMAALTGVATGTSVGGVSDLSGNAVYSALTAETTSDADRSSIANKLNSDPSLVEKLGTLSAEEIVKAHQDAELLGSDDALQKLVGPLPEDGFLTDAETAEKLAKFGPLVEQLRAGGDDFDRLLADQGFLDLLENGELDAENIEAFIKNPDSYTEYQEYKGLLDEFAEVEKSPNINNVLQFIFGDDTITMDSINALGTQLSAVAAIDPSSPEAVRLAQLKGLDVDRNGVINSKDMPALYAWAGNKLKGASFDDAISGTNTDKLNFSLRDNITKAIKPKEGATTGNAFVTALTEPLKDKMLTWLEMSKLEPAIRDRIWGMSDEWKKKYKVPSQAEYSSQVHGARAAAAAEADLASYKDALTSNGVSNDFLVSRATPGKNKDGDGNISEGMLSKIKLLLELTKQKPTLAKEKALLESVLNMHAKRQERIAQVNALPDLFDHRYFILGTPHENFYAFKDLKKQYVKGGLTRDQYVNELKRLGYRPDRIK